MEQDQEFRDLIGRVRAADPDAAAELVRRFEPEIRRLIRLRLTDPRLHRVMDSVDVCQSVMANFFVRAAAGQFELDRPEQLLHLLATMARNRLQDHVRRQHAGRRDQRRVQAGGGEALAGVPAPDPSPSQIVAGRELLEEVQKHLSEEERELAQQRAQGHDWAAIAAERGGTAEGLRKRLARGLDRVLRQMGLEKEDG